MAKTHFKSSGNDTKPINNGYEQKQGKIKKAKYNRKARLIIRNLSFKTTEENLRKHFDEFGEVQEVNILKKPNGQLVGCGFVQYKTTAEAAQALLKRNANKFLGRPIHVDWAVAKDTYVRHLNEDSTTENIEVKLEKDSDTDFKDVKIKEEVLSDSEEKSVAEIKSEASSDDEDEDMKSLDSESESESESDDSEDEEIIRSDNKKYDKSTDVSQINNMRRSANDATDGKTVFLKNVPFEAQNDDVKNCMEQFGEVIYALVCIDKLTEHSKGTAFVRFKELESAQRCLSSGTELTLLGQILDPHPALSRDQVHDNNSKAKQKPIKDSRNLYLVKEGVVLAGTKAAEGVSMGDMQKRLQLEQTKSQMLKNLNRFVSRYRLTIHNLPESYDDAKLRALCSVGGRVVREARVMRDSKPTAQNLKGTSKGFGFVSFTNHEDALATLRRLNNNPTIFSQKKRPIVAFSIEDKNAINAKIKRQQKSILQNPNKRHNAKLSTNIANTNSNKFNNTKLEETNDSEVNEYLGVTAKPGPQKMRSKFKLQTQAKLHIQNLKLSKKKLKNMKKPLAERKGDHIKQPKQKQNKSIQNTKDDIHLTKLINDYKDKLGQNIKKKSKWYEK